MAVLIQIDAWDPVAAAAVTLRAASHDDPMVCHLNGQVWWPALSKLPTLAYDLFDGAFGGQIVSPTTSFEMMAEAFPNLSRYSLASAKVQIWTGATGADWSRYTLRATGRVSTQPKIEDLAVSFDLEADGAWLDTPLLSAYAGSGGAEGGTSLTGTMKPLALGAPRYVGGVLIDPVNSVFQISAYGAIAGVEVAMDELVRFGASSGDYATNADLVAASIGAGSWGTCLAQGQARFGAPPEGKVCFLVQGDTAGPNGQARNAGQMIRRIAQIAGGLAYLDDASLNALDVACPWNLSLYISEQTTPRDIIQSIAQSVNATAGVSWLGKLFVAPVKIGASVLTLAADGSALPPVSTVSQENVDAPFWRLAIGAERTWEVHDLTDIAFGATFNPRGDYDGTATYRYGDVVKDAEGSRWVFIAQNPATGHAPPDSAYWDALDSSNQEALDRIAQIESDSILSAGEKPDIIRQVTAAQNEKGQLDAQADALGISHTTYDNAYQALMTYLGGLSPAWNDTSQDTAIVPATFNGKFTDYLFARTLLINANTQASAQSQGFSNRVYFSKFEKGTSYWDVIAFSPQALSYTKGAAAAGGYNYFTISATATAAGQLMSFGSTKPFSVTPGERLFAAARIEANQKATSPSLRVRYYDQAGANLSVDIAQSVSGPTGYGTRIGGFLPNLVPANAASATIDVIVASTAAGTLYVTLAEPMACAVPVGQTVFPTFTAGPNAVDGADVTAIAWNSLTGVDPATTQAQVTAAKSVADSATATAAIGAQLAADVADNNKFSSTEKKRWVEKINSLDGQVSTLISQANALGLQTQTNALQAQYTALKLYLSATVSGGPTQNTPPPNYLDTGHTSSINSNTFKSYVYNFDGALSTLSTAAQKYAQTVATQTSTSANVFTDSNFERITSSEWARFDSAIGIASDGGNRLEFPGGVNTDTVVTTQDFILGPNDMLDVEFEYVVRSGVTPAGALIVIQISGKDATAAALWTANIGLTVGASVKDTWTQYKGRVNVPAQTNYASTARASASVIVQAHQVNSIFIRKPKAYRVPAANSLTNTNGRLMAAKAQSSNSIAGLAVAQSLAVVITQTDGGGSITANIASNTYYFDDGSSISYPAGSLPGLVYQKTYFVWRNDPDLNGGTSYGASQTLTEAVGAGKIYLGFVNTAGPPGSGALGSTGGGKAGNQNCVDADAMVATIEGDKPARDIAPGDLVWCLSTDMTGLELVPVFSNHLADADQATLRTESGAELRLALDTPMDFPGGQGIAANAWSFPVGVVECGAVRWERAEVLFEPVARTVAHISLGGRTFAARMRGSLHHVLSHNVYK